MGNVDELAINDLTGRVIGACLEVHRHLGPGLLEKAYEACVLHELRARGIPCERQVMVPLVYKSIHVADAYRVDVLVAKRVVLEIKAVEKLLDVHSAQVLTYLRLTNAPVGLLVNFHSALLKSQLRRLSNPSHRLPLLGQ